MKQYNSFEEIDKDLHWLRLQSEIDKEELKLSMHETKESFSLPSMATTIIGSAATAGLLMRVLAPVLGFGIKKILKKYS
tara:strand:+ start:4057 stop:4293 length:237 start_codon:yes stop_codon:yes gene_type:complete